jgi:AcrR family transcriptional regulator
VASGPAERARLLVLARDYVLTRGVVDLSLSELARGVGSNNRMLLYHFGSLDGILGAAVDEILDGTALTTRLGELLRCGDSSDDSLAERVGAAWRHISDPGRLTHLRLFFTRFGLAADNPDRYRDFLDRTRDEWTDTVAAALDGAVEEPRGTAIAIVGLWRGLQMLLIGGEPREAVDAAHDRAVAALLGRE